MNQPPFPAAGPSQATGPGPRDHGALSRADRQRFRSARGATLWLTGLPGAGKSTIASELELRLLRAGVEAYRLDGDVLRSGLNADLGFLPADRAENVRRIAHVARLFADAGVVAIVSVISPFRADRDAARRLHELSGEPVLPFLEVHVSTPLDVCEQRDPKGLYRRARAGEIRDLTGVGSPYEAPLKPELVLPTQLQGVGECADACIALLAQAGVIP